MAEQILEALSYPPIQRALLACLLCGASCALLSVFVVLMKMPLIGVSMSHAAFAGAVLGMLLDVNPFLSGLILCLLTAAVLGPRSDRGGIAPENLLGILFSFLLGIAFLGMGILTQTKAGALNLMWGSLLTLSLTDLAVLAIVTAVLAAFVVLFFKEIRAVLFNRRLAASAGVPER
jgi:manganese/iron transport system permease protein